MRRATPLAPGCLFLLGVCIACNASTSNEPPPPAAASQGAQPDHAPNDATPETAKVDAAPHDAPADGPVSLASVPRASPLNRPVPGTDWARHGDLIGRVQRVRTTVTSPPLEGSPGDKPTRTEVVEFNEYGQRVASWYDGERHEEAKLGPDGNVSKLLGVPDPEGVKMRPSYEYLAYDDAHRVLRQSVKAAMGELTVDQIVTYAYDAQGHVISETRAGSPGADGQRKESVTSYTYDAEGDWVTRTDSDRTTSRVLVAVDATNKTLETRAGSVATHDVIDRSTGRVVSTGWTQTPLEHTYSEFDDRNNWTKLSIHRRTKSDDKLEWLQDVEREIDYFE